MSWEYVKVKNVAMQIRGVSYNKEQSSEYSNTGYVPILRAHNIDGGAINYDNLVYVPDEVVSDNQYLKQFDIVIAASSGSINLVGKAGIFNDMRHVSFGAFCKVLRPNLSIVDPWYFHYFFQTDNYKRSIANLASGVNINNIRNEHLDELELPLPDIYTQKRIAAVLIEADTLIRKRKQAIAKLDELVQSVFFEMFGEPSSNPMGWEIRDFDYFAKIDTVMIKDFSGYEDYFHVGIDNIEKDTGNIIGCKRVSEENIISGKYLFTEKHIIYSKIRPYLNKVALPDFKGVCSADAYPILVDENVTNRSFFAYILRSKTFLNFIAQHSERTNIPKVNKEQLRTFKTICPSKELQDQFQKVYIEIMNEKRTMHSQLAKLEQNFQNLLHQAFTGKLQFATERETIAVKR